MKYALYQNANYPLLVGHAVKVIRFEKDSAFVTFLTGKARGVAFYCPRNEIGALKQREPRKLTTLDYVIAHHHALLAA